MISFAKKYFLVLLLISLCFFAVQPLFEPGFFSMHDDEQVGRLYELDQSLKAGHFPPRISQNLGFGYGYPFFNFYPAFVYYVAEIFVLLGVGYIASVKLMIGLGFLLSGLFMYLFAKEYLGKYGALVAGVAYVYAPYHAVDVYVRGALPEFWSFVFIPALFLFYKKLSDTNDTKYMVVAGVSLALLIFTHNLVAMMGGIFLGIYILFLLLSARKKERFMLLVMLSGALGLALSAFFWIPSFFERQYTLIEILTKELADYRQHFVYIRQLWDSPWGYGGSLYGLYDGLSFEIGKIHIVGSFLAALAGVYFYVKKNILWKIVLVFIVLLVLAAFMTTFKSEFVWNNLHFFSYIQFPWRFLLFTAFASSFLLGSLLLITKKEKVQIILAALLITVTIFLNKDNFKPERYLTNVADKNYINHDVIMWRTSNMAYEYVPKGVATRLTKQNTTAIAITRDETAKSSFTVLKGNISVKEIINKPHAKKFNVRSNGNSILRINTYSFPGWKIFIDSKEVTYSDNNKLKLIDISIPTGTHVIEAQFTDTPPRSIGNFLSIISASFIFLYGFIIFTKKKNKKTRNQYKKVKPR